MAFATVALVVATVYSFSRTQALNVKVAKLREGHEKERGETAARAARARRESVRTRVGGVAYALQRQLRLWVEEAPDLVKEIVYIYDGFAGEAREEAAALTQDALTGPMITSAREWLAAHGGVDLDRAEQRVQQLLQDATELDDQAATAIRRAFVRFYRATGWMNSASNDRVETYMSGAAIAKAYHDLEGCVTLLNEVVGEELRSIVL